MKPILQGEQISKAYGSGELTETVLSGIDLQLHGGEACVLLGPSGSGKTTLLSILGCMLSPSKGQVKLAGEPIDFSNQAQLGEIRRTQLGFIFQHSQLLPFLTVLENIALIAQNAGHPKLAALENARHLLAHLGLDKAGNKFPSQLSGGQRQRAAIARAMVHKPLLVLADEPTAALDWHLGETVVEMLLTQTKATHTALVVVTHDQRLVPRFDRLFQMERGLIKETQLK